MAKDSIVYVDRSKKPTYPNFVKRLMHPEMECKGPDKINLDFGDKKPWFEDDVIKIKRKLVILGQENYGRLNEEVETIVSAISLQEGLAIQERGIVMFRKFFGGKYLLLSSSLALHRDGSFIAPFLFIHDDTVNMGWCLIKI